MAKLTLTEEKLNRLVAESIYEVLEEAGFGGRVGTWLGGVAGRTRQGMQDFAKNFRSSYDQNFTGGTNSQRQANTTRTTGTANQTGNVTMADLKAELQKLNQAFASLENQSQQTSTKTQNGDGQTSSTPPKGGTTTPQGGATTSQGGTTTPQNGTTLPSDYNASEEGNDMQESKKRRKKQISEQKLSKIIDNAINETLKKEMIINQNQKKKTKK